jgi:hypothetical protein
VPQGVGELAQNLEELEEGLVLELSLELVLDDGRRSEVWMQSRVPPFVLLRSPKVDVCTIHSCGGYLSFQDHIPGRLDPFVEIRKQWGVD